MSKLENDIVVIVMFVVFWVLIKLFIIIQAKITGEDKDQII